MTKKPAKKGKSLKLALFIPWDENGAVFGGDRKPLQGPVIVDNYNIIPFPQEKPPDDKK